MTPADVAAYIGAAAWLPQIGLWVYRALTRPHLTVMFGRRAQVGYSSLGPIIAVPMSFGAERKDVVFKAVRLRVSHEGGDSHTFEWFSLGEVMGQIGDPTGRAYTLNRDLLPIALKIGVSDLVEKTVRCAYPVTRARHLLLFRAVASHVSYLASSKQGSLPEAALASRECFEYLEEVRNGMWWKSGRYSVEVEFTSSQTFGIRGGRWEFSLTEDDLREIRRNLAVVDAELGEMIAAKAEGRSFVEQQWVYVYPDLTEAS